MPCIAWGPGVGIRSRHVSSALVHALDWYPTLATFAGIQVPVGRVIDGRDIDWHNAMATAEPEDALGEANAQFGG